MTMAVYIWHAQFWTTACYADGRQALQVSYKQMQVQVQFGSTAFWTVLHLSSCYSLLIACLEAEAIHLHD